MELFGSSGARGVATTELTPELVGGLAAAAGTVWDADAVALARDTRTSGELYLDAAAAGLGGVGTTVLDLGVVPTPGVQVYAASNRRPALVVTASHNPPQYNGLKLVAPDGVETDPDGYERVERCYRNEAFARASWDEVGDRRSVEGTRKTYVDTVTDAFGVDRLDEFEFTVAIDPGHGAGCRTSPTIFQRLGCEVLTVNAQPDGHFPGRDPEPVPENLADLSRLVRVSEADLGIAHDGDADRARFVDETGMPISGDTALAALAGAIMEPGDHLVTAVDVSRRVETAVEAAGGSVVRTPIGSARIFAEVRSLLAEGTPVPIAGEGNGGIAFPEYRLVRDGAYLAARFLELLADRPASDIAAAHGGYHMERRRVAHDGHVDTIMDAISAVAQEEVRNGATLETIDGIRLDFGEAWVLVRPSGTEPIVRIVAEASDPDRATRLVERFEGIVTAARTKS